MSRLLSRSAFVIGVANLVMVAAATAQLPTDFKRLQSTFPSLERAWQEAKGTGDLTTLKAELRPMFLATDSETRMMAWGWIASHRGDMSLEQRSELIEFYISLRPDDNDIPSMRSNMARERFEAWPIERREEAYWEAINEGRVVVEEHFEIKKRWALIAAALDGLTDFAPLIKENASLIDEHHPRDPDFRYSEYLQWLLKLRGGRGTKTSGAAVAAERLAEYSAQEILDLMERDAAFRRVAEDALRDACKQSTCPSCLLFARIALAQRDIRVSHVDAEAAGKAQGWKPASPPSWMSELWRLTAKARLVEAETREEANRGDAVMRGPMISH